MAINPTLELPESITEASFDYRQLCLAFPIIDHTDRKLVEETIFYCNHKKSYYEFYIDTDRISRLIE